MSTSVSVFYDYEINIMFGGKVNNKKCPNKMTCIENDVSKYQNKCVDVFI